MLEPPTGCEGDRPTEASCRDLLEENSPGALAPPATSSPPPGPRSPGIVTALMTAVHHGASGRAAAPPASDTRTPASSGEAQGKWGLPSLAVAGGRCEQRHHTLSRGRHSVPGLSHVTSSPLTTSAAEATGSLHHRGRPELSERPAELLQLCPYVKQDGHPFRRPPWPQRGARTAQCHLAS